MNKKILIFFLLVAGATGMIVYGQKNARTTNEQMNSPANTEKNSPTSQSFAKADKIEVVHFHATQQCWSCITVGEYALKTVKEKFPGEYANGTISFRDINSELSENKEMVMKYKARGSSLFLNAIVSGQDNIEEDTNVWRMIYNENQFTSYLQDKLNNLLGKPR